MTEHYRDGSLWEEQAGYSRAVRRGSRICVSGTTSHAEDGSALYPGDVYRQTRDALSRAIAAVEALGGAKSDIVRTRIFLVLGSDWERAARAHAELLGDVAPANTTLYTSGLIGDDLLVEVEVDAEVSP